MDFFDYMIPIFIAVGIVLTAVNAVLTYKVCSKHPKLYILFNLLIMLYPYVYMLVLLGGYLFNTAAPEEIKSDYFFSETLGVGTIIFFTIHPLIIGSLIGDFLLARREKIPARQAAKVNMLIKLVQIPAYVFHFILGMIGTVASIWGIGFILFAVIIDIVTIVFSGTQCLAAIRGIYKQKGLLKWQAILFAFLSYIYCVDVAISIAMFVMISKRSKTV